jgi:hypothetical protein
MTSFCIVCQLQPQEISPPPTANLDRSNDKVYENVTGLVKAVIEMSSKIQPAPPEEYVPMVKVKCSYTRYWQGWSRVPGEWVQPSTSQGTSKVSLIPALGVKAPGDYYELLCLSCFLPSVNTRMRVS